MFTGSGRSALSNAARRWAREAFASPSRILVINAFLAAVIFDMLFCLELRSCAGEQLEETTPVAFGVKDAAHLITTCPVTVKETMFQLNARTVLAHWDEAHLNFRLESGVWLPVGTDVPGEHQARGRFPREHHAPITRASVVTALVPATADVRLNHRVHGVGLAD